MTSNQIAWLQTRVQQAKNEFDRWKQEQDVANAKATLEQKDRELNLRQAELEESKRRNDIDNSNAQASRTLEQQKYRAQNKSAQTVAKINAKSSQRVSKRQASTSKAVAKINSSSAKRVAKINSSTSKAVAAINARSNRYKVDQDYLSKLTTAQIQARNAKAIKLIDKAIADKKVDTDFKIQLKKMKADLKKQKVANASRLEGMIATRVNSWYGKYQKWGEKIADALIKKAPKDESWYSQPTKKEKKKK